MSGFNPYWQDGSNAGIQSADDAWNIIAPLPIGKYLMLTRTSDTHGEIVQGRIVARDRSLGVVVLESENYPGVANVIALSNIQSIDTTRTGSGALGPVQQGDWAHDGQGNWYIKQQGPDAPHY
ncbi:hypothetical protein [Pseudomonas capeferrum]